MFWISHPSVLGHPLGLFSIPGTFQGLPSFSAVDPIPFSTARASRRARPSRAPRSPRSARSRWHRCECWGGRGRHKRDIVSGTAPAPSPDLGHTEQPQLQMLLPKSGIGGGWGFGEGGGTVTSHGVPAEGCGGGLWLWGSEQRGAL